MTEMRTARQFWIREPGRGEIVEVELAPPREGEVLVQTLYSGISRGTEALVFRGEVPPSQYDSMRAPFQEGDFPGPVKYGYISVGRVVAGPGGHGGSPPPDLLGRAVFCLHPHQDLYRVPAGAVTPLPVGLPPERAVLAAGMETAVNALWDGCPGVGDRIVVIGGGTVGLLVAWLCGRVPGARVCLVDPHRSRERVARGLGVAFLDEPPRRAYADLVIHASGDPAGLRAALASVGEEGTVVELSWYGKRTVQLPLGEAFHSRRLLLKSSQVGRVPPGRAPRWTVGQRMQLALDLLQDPRLDELITGESPFEELPRVLEALSRDAGDTLCHRIRYPEAPPCTA